MNSQHIESISLISPQKVMIVKYRNTYVLAALRTAIGRFGEVFKSLNSPELTAPLLRAAIENLV